MAHEFEAVKYDTLAEFEAVEAAILTHSGASGTSWGCIEGTDGTVLCVVDARIADYDFTPKVKATFYHDNEIYFPPE